MSRVFTAYVGAVMLAVTIQFAVTKAASSWFIWLMAALCVGAFVVAVNESPRVSRAGHVTGPLVLGVLAIILWILGTASGVNPWARWTSFAAGILFLAVALGSAGDPVGGGQSFTAP